MQNGNERSRPQFDVRRQQPETGAGAAPELETRHPAQDLGLRPKGGISRAGAKAGTGDVNRSPGGDKPTGG